MLFYNRALCKRNLNDYKGAIADYNQVLLLDPKNDEAYNNRGYAKHLLNDNTGACADFNKASALGNKLAPDNIKKYCK